LDLKEGKKEQQQQQKFNDKSTWFHAVVLKTAGKNLRVKIVEVEIQS